jgi:hypothetical protein
MKRYLLLLISAALLISFKAYPQHSGPVSQSACLGETVEFAVEHSFDYVTFSWEESTDNVNFAAVTAAGYSGAQTDALTANTGVLNPTVSGFYRFYRCHMFSDLYGWTYSDVASLEINFPPEIDFTWENPCQDQTTHFIPTVTGGQTPYKYLWEFNDNTSGISVYPDPSYLFSEESTYNVKLTVTDANGCVQTVTKAVQIFSIPALTVTGKEVVCSNELGVKYAVDLAGENIHYSWDVAGFGTIEDNTLKEINIDWNAVTIPTQTKLILTITIDPSGCSTQVSYDVLITTYVAPPEGTVFRKPYESTVLIYKGPEVNSYKWGSTDNSGVDHYMPKETGEKFYCDFQGLDGTWDYWVETSYDSRINCVTRSYYDWGSNKLDNADLTGAFTVYPVPAYNRLNVRFDKSTDPSGIAVYNMMMQKVFEDDSPVAAQNEYAISLENFISGIYIIQVTDDSGISNFRVFTIEK